MNACFTRRIPLKCQICRCPFDRPTNPLHSAPFKPFFFFLTSWKSLFAKRVDHCFPTMLAGTGADWHPCGESGRMRIFQSWLRVCTPFQTCDSAGAQPSPDTSTHKLPFPCLTAAMASVVRKSAFCIIFPAWPLTLADTATPMVEDALFFV